jgi:lysozyme family protein
MQLYKKSFELIKNSPKIYKLIFTILITLICFLTIWYISWQSDKKFEYAVNFVLAHEGGYSNDIDDKGGETNFGISKNSYPDLDIKTLTIDEAKTIYKRDFWEAYLYKDIKDINLATKVFDLAVNIGPNWAHRLVQRALRATGYDILEDGILGPMMLIAINKANLTDLLAALKSEAAGYYRTLAATKPKQAKFLKRWLKRAYA